MQYVQKRQIPVLLYFKRNTGIIIGLVLLTALFTIFTNNFLTISNILTMLQNNAVNAIICCGMLMAIMMGQIDISVGSIVGLTAMVAGIPDHKSGMQCVCGVAGISACRTSHRCHQRFPHRISEDPGICGDTGDPVHRKRFLQDSFEWYFYSYQK